ncbi:MAG: DUF4142 domain-containing protein [Steroidobacteraceae bacterium]
MNRNHAVRFVVITSLGFASISMAADKQKLPPEPQAPAATAASVPQSYSDTTREFLNSATANNTFIVKAGNLALRKSNNAEVKQIAQQIVRDHVKGYDGFGTDRAVAKATDKTLRPEQKTMFDQLEKAGSNFDTLYIDQMVVTLRDALANSQKYATGGTEALLKEAAADAVTLDTANLNLLENIQAKLHGHK